MVDEETFWERAFARCQEVHGTAASSKYRWVCEDCKLATARAEGKAEGARHVADAINTNEGTHALLEKVRAEGARAGREKAFEEAADLIRDAPVFIDPLSGQAKAAAWVMFVRGVLERAIRARAKEPTP